MLMYSTRINSINALEAAKNVNVGDTFPLKIGKLYPYKQAVFFCSNHIGAVLNKKKSKIFLVITDLLIYTGLSCTYQCYY